MEAQASGTVGSDAKGSSMNAILPHDAGDRLKLEFFSDLASGYFVEVGANEPRDISQTWELEQRNWLGILIEPQPDLAAVLRREGEDLAYLVKLVMRRLQAISAKKDWVPPIAFAGSIMEKIPAVREALLASVRKEFPEVSALAGVVDPIEGAVARARMARQTVAL